ncbi:MAG: hypothetical protein ACRCU9_00265, partial [Iodobacter sp.]
FEPLLNQAQSIDVQTNAGQASMALMWANLLKTGTVSFHVHPDWQNSWIDANVTELDENGALSSSTKKIRNISSNQHVIEHHNWLQTLGFEDTPDAISLWNERESRYQGLRFLPGVKKQLSDLATNGASYKQALICLKLLNNDSLAWNGVGEPKFSAKVAAGEHDQRRTLCDFYDEVDGTSQTFDRHGYFTGGTPGRVYFRLSSNEKKLVIAHVGAKLL